MSVLSNRLGNEHADTGVRSIPKVWERHCARRKEVLVYVFAALLATIVLATAKESGWQLIKIDGRDYLSLENIARFYQLQGNAQTADHRVSLGDGHAHLEIGGNPREIYVNGVKQWLSFPAIIQNDQILISRFDLAKTIEPCLRPTMIPNLRAFRTVVIDAGHGGKDRGASSRTGAEKTYTLDVSRDLKQKLEAMGLRVIVTRDGDEFLPLESRADLANASNDAVFVSLHFNSSGDSHANGFEVYAVTPQGAASTADATPALDQFEGAPGNDFENASLALATCVQHSILGHLPQIDRGVRRARFAVLRLTHAPAILVEGGFLTNDLDGRNINDATWRERLAESIAQGIKSFQDVAVYGRPPKLLADYRGEQLPLLGTIVNPASLASRSSEVPGEYVAVNSLGVANGRNAPVKADAVAPPEN